MKRTSMRSSDMDKAEELLHLQRSKSLRFQKEVKIKRQQSWLFYPDQPAIEAWNLYVMIILIVTCIITPLNLALVFPYETEALEWLVF